MPYVTLPRPMLLDANGVPRVAAKMYVYDAGTTTPHVSYTGPDLVTEHPNPIISVSNGYFPSVWVDPDDGDYKLTFEDANGVPLPVDQDNIPARENFTSDQIAGVLDSLALTEAEIASGVTPTNFAYPPGDVRRYGFATDATAAGNSTALQNASEVAYQSGGGVIRLPAGTFFLDTPPRIFETVSIVGEGKNSTILKKTTSTASTVSDATVRFWDSAAVGNPVCVLHFVGYNGTDNWSYAECRDFQVQGNTENPNTSTTTYGLFFRGMTGGRVRGCFAQFVQVGYFWGGGATITSEIAENNAGNVQRGFYQHFMTSTSFHHNYANKFRYVGYFLSWYYSNVFGNAADNVAAPWKVGTTEISLAYQGNSCRGGVFHGNGCETHNGSVFKFSNCLSVRFLSNLALDITSNYTGGSDVVLWENDSNNSCVYEDNRMQTTSVTGTGARHFIWKITSELGEYIWQRNRFVANATDTTDTSTWTNTSGTLQVAYEEGSYTGTATGISGAPTGTVRFVRNRNGVILYLPTITGTSSATTFTITGMPAGIRPVRQQRILVRVADNGTVNEGSAIIETSGVITLQYGSTEAAWTASGTKTVFFGSLAYGLS